MFKTTSKFEDLIAAKKTPSQFNVKPDLPTATGGVKFISKQIESCFEVAKFYVDKLNKEKDEK